MLCGGTKAVMLQLRRMNVLFGTDRLLEVMNRHTDSDPQTLLTQIKAAVDAFVGEADQFDDLTMLGIHLSAL